MYQLYHAQIPGEKQPTFATAFPEEFLSLTVFY